MFSATGSVCGDRSGKLAVPENASYRVLASAATQDLHHLGAVLVGHHGDPAGLAI